MSGLDFVQICRIPEKSLSSSSSSSSITGSGVSSLSEDLLCSEDASILERRFRYNDDDTQTFLSKTCLSLPQMVAAAALALLCAEAAEKEKAADAAAAAELTNATKVVVDREI